MVGITSYSAYIPWYRMSRAKMGEATNFLIVFPPPGERSVPNQNEDSVTMGAAAALYCLDGEDRGKIEGFYFATSTPVYIVRQQASIISNAIDLNDDIRVADFTSGNKAGTTALMNAIDAVKAGSLSNVLVSAADCRVGKPGNPQESVFGAGAAAFIIGKDDVVAELEGAYSLSIDFVDRWRAAYEPFDHCWEDRWIRDEGYEKIMPQAISEMLKRQNLSIKDIDKIGFCYPHTRGYNKLAQKMEIEPAKLQDCLIDNVGDTCAAHSLMMLIGALEEAKAGDRILIASWGQGMDVLLFRVTDRIGKMKNKWGIKKNLARRKDLDSWEKFAAITGAVDFYKGPREGEYAFASYSMAWRERKEITKLYGHKCRKCGTIQFPPRHICVNPECKAIDQMEDIRLSDKKGKVFSLTNDYMITTGVAMPPMSSGYINLDKGGRIYMQICDVDLAELKVGMPVEMTVRRRHVDAPRGVSVYQWVAVPARE